MPIGHLGLNVADLEVARAYYDRLMPALEFELFLSDADQFAYRPAGGKPGTYLFVYPARAAAATPAAPGLQHVAFMVRTRSAVDGSTTWCVSSARRCCTSRATSPSTRSPTTRPSGSTRTASCSRPSATTTAPDPTPSDRPPTRATDRSGDACVTQSISSGVVRGSNCSVISRCDG